MPELFKMFHNLDDFGNVPQDPGYPGYQLLATLPPDHVIQEEDYIKFV